MWWNVQKDENIWGLVLTLGNHILSYSGHHAYRQNAAPQLHYDVTQVMWHGITCLTWDALCDIGGALPWERRCVRRLAYWAVMPRWLTSIPPPVFTLSSELSCHIRVRTTSIEMNTEHHKISVVYSMKTDLEKCSPMYWSIFSPIIYLSASWLKNTWHGQTYYFDTQKSAT